MHQLIWFFLETAILFATNGDRKDKDRLGYEMLDKEKSSADD